MMSRRHRHRQPRPTSYVTKPMRAADWHAMMERYRSGPPTLGYQPAVPPPTEPPATEPNADGDTEEQRWLAVWADQRKGRP